MTLPLFGYIACLLLAALLSTRLMKVLRLPNVTGYIITGIIMGPFVFGVLFNSFSYDNIESSVIATYVKQISWLSDVALGFIAFSIGTSFKFDTLKAVGKKVLIITILESLFASIFVILALLGLHFAFQAQIPLELVLTLGAIAAATAPAATLMVIKQYRAQGEMVNTLLPVVALDDASALILFAILFQIASALSSGTGLSFYAMLGKPLLEIAMSLGLGAVIGLFISLLNRLFKSRNNRLVLCIFSVVASLGIHALFQNEQLGGFELSSLLMCMSSGALYVNLSKDSGKTFDVLDRFTSPLYLVFFVLSGASLDLKMLFGEKGLIVLGIAGVYVIFRVVGKYLGAFTGASISKCSPKVKKYLGLTLVPQAGVAIGLATSASNLFASSGNLELSSLVLAIILSSTLIYELVGPMVSKFALSKAGEIALEEKKDKKSEAK